VTATIAIPARLRSSRLARKVLLPIAGRPLIEHVHDVAVRARCGPVVVLADDEEVAAAVRAFGGEVLLTDPDLASGTARIASVIDQLEGEVIINLQGDAPLTDPSVLPRAATEAARDGAAVTLPVYRLRTTQAVHDPATVKVVRALSGQVLYCSRAPVPHLRDIPPADWGPEGEFWAHAGIYAYSREFLERFGGLPESPLEESERLEQLRWLEAGLPVHSFVVDPQGPSVDTEEDLERVRQALDGTEAAR
jgi:3-deoxy-D-manno-octulosonate cytidylyltransferase